MNNNDQVENKKTDYGSIKISDDVVAIIAGIASMEVDGVAGMSGGVTAGITEMLGKKNLAKGVKVDISEQKSNIDLYVIIEFGAKIPEVAQKIQENVRNSIEKMTGIEVEEVNVHVQGVTFDKVEKLDAKDDDDVTRMK